MHLPFAKSIAGISRQPREMIDMSGRPPNFQVANLRFCGEAKMKAVFACRKKAAAADAFCDLTETAGPSASRVHPQRRGLSQVSYLPAREQ